MARTIHKRMRRLAKAFKDRARVARRERAAAVERQSWRGFEPLESRMLLSATLGLTPMAGAGINVSQEGGVTVVEVPAGTTLQFEAAIASSDRSDIEVFQLDFTASNGSLTFGNWATDSSWSGQTFGGIINIDDGDISDLIVTGSVSDPGLGATTLGTFDVTVPNEAGEWLLTSNVPGQINTSTLAVSGTALAADVFVQIFPPAGGADLVNISDYGDVLLRVLPATNPSISIADAAAVAEGDNAATTELTFAGRVRDFRGEGTTSPLAALSEHTDFEDEDALLYRIENPNIPVLGAVSSTLGGDGKPVFVGGTTFSTGANFNQWYNDTAGVNLGQDLDLTFTFDGENYTFDGTGPVAGRFYPIDDALGGNTTGAEIFGDPVPADHNWHFTYEAAGTFVYQPGQEITVTADDDLWLYIDGQLVIDRGGVNIAITTTASLDGLGLTPGQTYDIDMFYAERHTTDAVLQITTNIPINFTTETLSSFAEFEVTLSEPSPVSVRVDFSTADGTGQAGQDYVATSGTLVFAPGETSKTVRVPIIGDTVEEAGDKAFTVVLSNATNASISDGTGEGTITDDDETDTNDASISGVVWRDTTANSVNDGEAGVQGVTVNLFATGGVTPLQTTTTAGDGTYSFSGLSAGGYFVEFVPDGSETFVQQDVGGDDTIDSDANTTTGATASFTLAIGEAREHVDAGLAEGDVTGPTVTAVVLTDDTGSSDSDRLTNDLTPTLTVTFSEAVVGDAGDVSVTGPDGAVSPASVEFSGETLTIIFDALLTDGDYVVTLSGGSTITDESSNPLNDGTDEVITFTLDTLGPQIAGVFPSGTVNSPVSEILVTFSDDGALDEATVTDTGNYTLFASGGDGTFTDDNEVDLTSLIQSVSYDAGTKTATIALNAAIDSSESYQLVINGTSSVRDAAGNALGNGSDLFANFQIDIPVADASVGDRVFADLNGNGIQDAGELGVPDVAVSLLDEFGGVVDSTATDAQGNYSFAGLAAGTYRVLFTAPAGTTFSVQDSGGDDSIDSDADPLTGLTDTFTLAASEARTDIDAGVVVVQSSGDGQLDSTFAAAGFTIIDVFNGDFDTPEAVLVQPDGKTIVVGRTYVLDNFTVTDTRLFVIRLNEDGSFDTTFSNDGLVTIAEDFININDAILQPDGKILIVGGQVRGFGTQANDENMLMIRLNPDGSKDNSFGNRGVVELGTPQTRERIVSVALQSDGKIVAALQTQVGGVSQQMAVARFNSNGVLDTSYGTQGIAAANLGFDFVTATDVHVTPSNEALLLGRTFSNDFIGLLVKFDSAGNPVTDFGTAGLVTVTFPPDDDISGVDSIAMQGDKILVGGITFHPPTQNVVAINRYHADGTLDTTFGDQGSAVLDVPDINGERVSTFSGNLIVQQDMRILFGTDAAVGSAGVGILGRFTADGQLDTTFGTGGVTVSFLANPGLDASDFSNLALTPDGNIIAAGRTMFPSSQTPTRVTVARFTSSIEPFIEIDVRGNNASIASGDVTPSAGDFTLFPNTALGGSSQRTFTIVNQGNTPLVLTGNPLVSISGADAAYFDVTAQPAGDTIPVGGSLAFTVTFTPDVERSDYTATVSVGNTDGDENPYTFDIAGAGVTQIEVGSLGGDGPTKASITDGLGNLFDFSFKGEGIVKVLQEASGRLSLELTGGSGGEAITIKPKAGDGMIHSLISDAGAKSVNAKGVNFSGDIVFDGLVGKFSGGAVADQHLVQFGGTATDKATKHTFDSFTNVTFISGAPVALTVGNWDDTDPDENPDTLTAPYSTGLTAKVGNWDAGIILTGESAPNGVVLKKFSAKTDAGGMWRLAGDAGKIAVGETGETFDVVVAGDVKGFTSKAGFTGLLAGHTLGKVGIKTDVNNARIIAGGDFDAAGLTSTFIKSLSIGGAMTLTEVQAGVHFSNDDPDDIVDFHGGIDHYIKSAKIGGEAGDDNHFTAGLFPKTVSINKVKVDPLNDPVGRFTLTDA